MLLAACLALLPWVAAAEPSPMQMMIQVGTAFGPQFDTEEGFDMAGTIGLLWIPWKFGGLWSEAGVMNEPFERPDICCPPFDDGLAGEPSYQHLEASAGLLAVGNEPTTGYLKAGLGAFRSETGGTARKFLVGVPTEHVAPGGTMIHWTMGAIVAAGLRFGSERMRALPTIEWRAQVEPDAYGETQVLLMATGGVWFR